MKRRGVGRAEPLPPFFDPEVGGPVQVQLLQDDGEFQLLRRIAYRDAYYEEPFIVPADLASFRTDLASIPWFFAWLVPGVGTHLPAVLIHDGLVVGPNEGKTHIGPNVDREEADRILRDGMATLGVGRVRRWSMWAAVTLGTALKALKPHWLWVTRVVGTILIVAVLGALATLDLFDIWDVLPWMKNAPWWVEFLSGLGFALLIPLLISTLWGPLWKAGAITGLALALLFHVTLAVFVVYGIYWLLEEVVSSPEGSGPDARSSYRRAIQASSV